MSSHTDSGEAKPRRRGFVLGELFVAVLLLALAISSVTALMYSVTRHPRIRPAVDCAEQGAVRDPKCAATVAPARAKASTASKLLVAGCATRSGAKVQACKDSVRLASNTPGTTLKSRTDSASLALIRKPKPAPAKRPDLGFIR